MRQYLFIMYVLFTATFLSADNYYIKIGSYSIKSNAKKVQRNSQFHSKIIFVSGLYAVVTQKIYQSRKEADFALTAIKDKYHDAYLYKIPKIITANAPMLRESMQEAINTYTKGDFEGALAMFDKEMILYPNDKLAHLYYAKTLFRLNILGEAKGEFEKIIKSDATTKIVSEVRGYLDEMERRRKKHFFNGSFSIGTAYDNNVNLNPDIQITQYGKYLLQNDTTKTKSNYMIASLFLSHLYKGKYFELYTTLNSYSELMHTAKNNDLNFWDLSTELSKSFGKATFSLSLGTNISYLDAKKVSTNIKLSPSFYYKILPNYTLLSDIKYQTNRSYFANDRDYTLIGGGLGLRYAGEKTNIFTKVNSCNFKKKRGERYDIDRNLLQYIVDVRYKILKDLYLNGDIVYEHFLYKDLDDVLGYKREEIKLIYSILLTKYLSKDLLVSSKFEFIENSSNINTYEYQKSVISALLKYYF